MAKISCTFGQPVICLGQFYSLHIKILILNKSFKHVLINHVRKISACVSFKERSGDKIPQRNSILFENTSSRVRINFICIQTHTTVHHCMLCKKSFPRREILRDCLNLVRENFRCHLNAVYGFKILLY